MKNYKQMEFDLGSVPEVSPVSIYLKRVRALESLGNGVDCGRKCFVYSEMLGPDGQLLSRFQPFAVEGLPWSFRISSRSGVMLSSGIAYPLTGLVPLISEIGFSSSSDSQMDLWPTPTTSGIKGGNKRYSQGGLPLSAAVKMWPTPTTRDRTKGKNAQGSDQLGDAVRKNPGCSRDISGGSSQSAPLGSLTPEFCEWLQGFPVGFTDLDN